MCIRHVFRGESEVKQARFIVGIEEEFTIEISQMCQITQ